MQSFLRSVLSFVNSCKAFAKLLIPFWRRSAVAKVVNQFILTAERSCYNNAYLFWLIEKNTVNYCRWCFYLDSTCSYLLRIYSWQYCILFPALHFIWIQSGLRIRDPSSDRSRSMYGNCACAEFSGCRRCEWSVRKELFASRCVAGEGVGHIGSFCWFSKANADENERRCNSLDFI
jgi:hypothetical protein